MAFLRDLFGMGESQKAHQQVYGGGDDYDDDRGDRQQSEHQSSWTHEMVAGAAGFAGKMHILFNSI